MATNPTTVNSITPEAARAEIEHLIKTGEALSNAKQQPIINEINGHSYVAFNGNFRRVEEVEPPREKQPEPFKTFSLQGLVDFIKKDVDGIFDGEERHIVRVVGHDKVEVVSPVRGFHKQRTTVAFCNALAPRIPFDIFMDTDRFQITVQTMFAESENRAKVLLISGSVRNEQNMQTADDGVSQKITISKGVVTTDTVTIKNPVPLTPLRTFYEIEQPSSPFILRFNEDGEAALFEGDGGAWKLEAVKNIAAWLEKQLDGYNVEIIA